MKKQFLGKYFATATQFLLPIFTIGGFALTALKHPDWGLLSNLIAQIFWIPSSYLAWKNAGQIGIFITAIIITAITLFGVINYWFY